MHFILVLTFWLHGDMLHQYKYPYATEHACQTRGAQLAQEFGQNADGTKIVTFCAWAP